MRVSAVLFFIAATCAPFAYSADPLTLTTPEQENKLGEEAFKEILSKEKGCQDAALNEYVKRVAFRVIQGAPDMGFKYEVVVLESDKVNAFCLPGGKIAVYTGILPYCENEAGLATVLGHEIAHATRRHGGQRMTQGTVVNVVGVLGSELLKQAGAGELTQTVAQNAYGYGSQIGILLPYGRSHETEADFYGLRYMARAGYDPSEAPKFWKRFSVMKSNTPTFLSTHPASEERAARLEEVLPNVKKLYDKAPNKYGSGEAIPAGYREVKKASEPEKVEKVEKKKKKN
jgi:metalloendopeptidase OMA1, mitochondrial